ncbi:Asp/Glu racemase [Kiloniella spongiae]|uniref:Asp/Glu racemase n=1 Tax=Kiloniella spongiae TaxID=1489064 RepID=A0A0H2MMM7_9PROT|nr:aspartate/glutamate racemase family protein [Kiloniella spongiae]KLN61992.1 Asp/Glu racemase [Kiloniella spongiae]
MKLDFTLDKGTEVKACLGLIVLQADETLENEFRHAIRDFDVSLFHSRIPSRPSVTKETLAQMANDMPTAAGLLPQSTAFDAIAYACTSGATVIGPSEVAAKIHSQHPGAPVTDPITAVIAACRVLQINKLGFLTPYVPEVSNAMRTLLEDNRLEIAGFGSFEQDQEKVVSRISEASTLDGIVQVGQKSDCDGVFVSCTNLRTLGILDEAEQILGKPVISSNLALIWHMLRLAGVDGRGTAPGKLFAQSLLSTSE